MPDDYRLSLSLTVIKEVHNFNSGPAALPEEVKEEAKGAIDHFANSPVGILESYHRSDAFQELLQSLRTNIRLLLKLGDEQEVLILPGGASQQFAMIPYNFLSGSEQAVYAISDIWSEKAMKAAASFGKVIPLYPQKERSFIPAIEATVAEAKYLHITSNNTVNGSCWNHLPEHKNLILDATSDLLAREWSLRHCALSYAGMQKNMGIAGCSVVIIRKDFMADQKQHLAEVWNYAHHIQQASLSSTPPTFAIFVAKSYTNWILQQGGVAEMEKRNRAKAAALYNVLDNHLFFENRILLEERSFLNVTFQEKGNLSGSYSKRELEFISFCESKGVYGLKGHRSRAGLRAALYNGVSMYSVERLIECLLDFK